MWDIYQAFGNEIPWILPELFFAMDVLYGVTTIVNSIVVLLLALGDSSYYAELLKSQIILVNGLILPLLMCVLYL